MLNSQQGPPLHVAVADKKSDIEFKLHILDKSNYTIWKKHMLNILEAKGLLKIVTEGEQAAPGIDSKARALLTSALNADNQMKVINANTAYEIWKRLESTYENKTSFERETLLNKLYSYKINSSAEIANSISEMENVVARLRLLNEQVSDQSLMAAILKALPKSFKTFIAIWRGTPIEERTLNNMISRLMAEVEDDKPGAETGLMASRKFQSNKKKILEHRITPDGREFYVKWKGYNKRHNSWVPEKDLDGALDLLQKYLRKHDLPLSNIEGLLGAQDDVDVQHTYENWITLTKIMNIYIKYKNRYLPFIKLNYQRYEGEINKEDTLLFIDHNKHCFVILYLHKKNLGYLADGGNQFRYNKKTKKEIKNIINYRLISCRYRTPTKVDNCGTAAILIALEFTKAYHHRDIPFDLLPPPSWKKRIENVLHKNPSQLLEIIPLRFRKQKYICFKCNSSFKNQRGLALHKLHCSQKSIEK